MDKQKLLAFARARLKPVTCLDEIQVLACEPGLARLHKMPSAMPTAAGCIPCVTAAAVWPPARAAMRM